MASAALVYFSTFMGGYFWFQIQKNKLNTDKRLTDLEDLMALRDAVNEQLKNENEQLQQQVQSQNQEIGYLKTLRTHPEDSMKQLLSDVMHILTLGNDSITHEQIDRLKSFIVVQDELIMPLEQESGDGGKDEGDGSEHDVEGDVELDDSLIMDQPLTNPYVATSIVASPLSNGSNSLDDDSWTIYLTQQPIE